jgi:LuxR family maltose regulon positive regulatory protein
MPGLDAFIRHAITPPAFDQAKVHRHRLVDALHAQIAKKLIVVAAPPGYGKTTLLADFHYHTEIPTCWVRLTEADADVMRLASVLQASLARRFRRLRGRPHLESLSAASPKALARVFAAAVDEQVSEPFAILMDEVHLVNASPPVLEFLDEFIEAIPGQVTLVAAGREVLDVSLARLMASGDLAGFGPQDMALTPEELAQVARSQLGLSLDASAVENLMEETRGWVTGVLLSRSLASETLRDMRHTASPLVYEYLASVVLNRLADDTRTFVLEVSILPVMTPEACDAVLGRVDSGRMLARLSRSGMFLLSAGAGSGTFEFHPQFREFLLSTMAGRDRKRLAALRARAAEWFSRSAEPERAVELYFEAGRPRQAAALADELAWPMRRAGRLTTLEGWAGRCLKEGCRALWLILEYAGSCEDHGQFDRALELIDQHLLVPQTRLPARLRLRAQTARGMLLYQAGRMGEVGPALERARASQGSHASPQDRAEVMRLEAKLLAGERRWERAEQVVGRAIRLLQESGDRDNLAIAQIDLSQYQFERGDYAAVVRSITRALPTLETHAAPGSLGVAYNNLAGARHLLGEFDRALQAFSQALRCARLGNSEFLEAMVLFGEADLFSDLGLAFQAGELYGAGLTLATQLDRSDLIAYGCLQTAMLHRRSGTPAIASEWLKRAASAAGRTDPPLAHSLEVGALELLSAPNRAERRLQRLLEAPGVLTSAEHARALYLQARCVAAEGSPAEAAAALTACLDWVGGTGTEQAIAGDLRVDVDMRRRLLADLGAHPTARRLIERIEAMEALARQYDPGAAERSPKGRIEFLALGQAVIQCPGGKGDGLSRMARELAFLLLDSGRVERDVLVEVFWPDHTPGRQTANLHMAVYQLRQALGKSSLVQDGSAYSLVPSASAEYDVHRFERAASLAERLPAGDPRRMFALTEAVASYGGAFLPGSDSLWVVERRRQLQGRYLDLLVAAADESMVRNQVSRAAALLREALAHDPLRDDLNEQLMHALHRLGRRNEIVELYLRYTRALADSFGLDPPIHLRELYSRLIS